MKQEKKYRNAQMKWYKLCFISIFTILVGCVPYKFFNETETERNDCKLRSNDLLAKNEVLTVENTELKSKLELSQQEKLRIEEEATQNIAEIENLKNRFNQLNKRYNELGAAHEAMISGSAAESRDLMKRLDNAQKDLIQKEDQLYQLSLKIDKERDELETLRNELEQRSSKLSELEKKLAKRDTEVDALKKKVSDALTGFENQGLTITKKNGKIYVSLEEQLLFSSGSTEVDARGKNALEKLAFVLEQNPDINITIEGHTDDVPVIPGSSYKDNWDLSVQRSTAIIRILLDDNNINPKRLTASGRGEYMPVDTGKTSQAKQKNRRTEIILTPKLDELFEILE